MSTRKLLRRKAASDYLRETHGLQYSPGTLAKLAVIGGGPPFQRAGRFPYYSPDFLDEWVASKLSALMRSTSDTASPKDKIVTQPYLGEECEDPDNGALSKAGA
jgi:hypothetical protein